MTVITALELFTHPLDLEFAVGENTEKVGTWALAIMRGPGHNSKLILTGEDIPSKESAIATIVSVLNVALEKGSEMYTTSIVPSEPDFATDLLKVIVNPCNVPLEKAGGVLRPEMVLRIEQELNATGQCTTYTWGIAV